MQIAIIFNFITPLCVNASDTRSVLQLVKNDANICRNKPGVFLPILFDPNMGK